MASNGTIVDVPGIKIGHAQDRTARTGCTVVLTEAGSVCGVDVRGSAPGTRETDLLRPTTLVEKVDAGVLYVGSALGLTAACGVDAFLVERGIGFRAAKSRVTQLAAAAITGRKVIGDLMDVFWEGAEAMPKDKDPDSFSFAGKAAALFSPNYRKVFRHFANEPTDLPEQYHRFQLVTDYICGMTDSFAKRLQAERFNGR